MGMYLKLTLKDIFKNKFRSFLIILAIVISSGAFFASISLSDSIQKMMISKIKSFYGSSDIYISGSSKTPFFKPINSKELDKNLEYKIGQIKIGAMFSINRYKDVRIILNGVNFEQLELITPIEICQKDKQNFNDDCVIVNKISANKYNLKIGDIIKLSIDQGNVKLNKEYKVWAISEPLGPLYDEGTTVAAIVSKKGLADLFKMDNKVNFEFIKVKDKKNIKNILSKLNKQYDKCIVERTISEDELKEKTSEITSTLLILFSALLCICMYIIYSSYKVVIMERLRTIALLRSLGATRKKTNFILILESIVYGLIGGAFGCAVGIVILYIFSNSLGKSMYIASGSVVNTTIHVPLKNFLGTFTFSILVCVFCSFKPIVKAVKMSINHILLNKMKYEESISKRNLIIGILTLFTCIILFYLGLNSGNQKNAYIQIILVILSLIMLMPYIVKIICCILCKFYQVVFKNLGRIAINNLKVNSSINKCITILAIAISIIIMFNTVIQNNIKDIKDLYKNSLYDVRVSQLSADKNIIDKINNTKDVYDIYSDYFTNNVVVHQSDIKIKLLEGIDNTKFFSYWNNIGEKTFIENVKKIDKNRNIMISNTLLKRYSLKVGDNIELVKGSEKLSYKIIGSFRSFKNQKDCAIIANKYIKEDFKIKNSGEIYVKVKNNPLKVTEELSTKLKYLNANIQTKNQLQENELNNKEQFLKMISSLSILTLVIGWFGVINNNILSFITRERNFCMYRSIGMNKVQLMKVLLIESFSGGMIGALIGCLNGIILVSILGRINSAKVFYDFNMFLRYSLIGIFIMIISSIIPLIKSYKINLISNIKYE